MAATSAVATPAVSRGGFWVRTGAYILDSIIVLIAGVIAYFIGSVVDASLGLLLYYVVAIGYFLYFWSAGGGQTLGMKALDLKVVRTDGSQLTFMQAVIRYIGLIVASIPLGIGLIWVAFDENKQGWHDKIAGTYVIRTK